MCAKKKERITAKQIEQDIIHSLKTPREMAKSAYKKMKLPCFIAAVLLVILTYIRPMIVLWVFLLMLPCVGVVALIDYLWRRHKRKSVCIDDYDIITEVLFSTFEESYFASEGKGRGRMVYNYILHFENGEKWHIPKENYTWSEERQMSDYYVYQNAHHGDVFVLAIKKDTGKIAMAYDTEFFEYKEG